MGGQPPKGKGGLGLDVDVSTSLEQLDAMLADGRVTQSDYDTLKSALTGAPAQRPGGVAGGRPRLTKSWTNRQVGGVCGGWRITSA